MKRLAALVLALSLPLASCAPEAARPETRIRDDLMGTVMTLSVYSPAGGAVLADIFDRISEIEDKMTAHRDGGEVAAVGAGAGRDAVRVSEETHALLRTALDIARLSDGAFDPTIGPLVKLWGIGTPEARLPSDGDIAAARALIGWRDLLLAEDGQARLAREGMSLDLGGIAKGYAGDEALRVARAAGVAHALFNLGGNVVACGGNPDGTPWRIGLQKPEPDAEGWFGVLSLSDGAVVTSGGYERYFVSDGVRYHHIFDPLTGYPADSGLLSVTVVHESSAWADGLSTACFVLGYERGAALLEAVEGAEGVFVTTDKRVYVTSGLQDRFTLSDPDYTPAAP